MGQPNIAADGRAAADGDAAKDRRAHVDDDVVLDNRMAGVILDQDALIIDEAKRFAPSVTA